MSIQDIVKRAVLALGFEERAGTIAFDSSPKHNNGTLGAGVAAPTWVAGKDGFGGALEFNGGNHLAITSDVSLDPGTGDMTWAVWIKTTDTVAYIYNNYEGVGDDRVEFRILDSKIRFLLNDAGDATWRESLTTVVDDEYHRIVVVWKGSLATGTMDIYIDGKLDNDAYGSQQITGADIVPMGATDYIGMRGTTAVFLIGDIDGFLILPYAWTPEEVRADYESRSAFTATPNLRRGLVLDLDLQEGAELTAFDRSWYANNATLLGAGEPAWVEGGGLDFDGTDDFVTCSLTLDWNNIDFTVIVQASLEANDEFRGIMGNRFGAGSANWWTLGVRSSGELIVEVGPASAVTVESGIDPAGLGEITYAVVKDGGLIELFMDGLSKGTTDISGKDLGGVTNELRIGRWVGADQIWKGIIKRPRIYNRALTPAEIRALYEEGR